MTMKVYESADCCKAPKSATHEVISRSVFERFVERHAVGTVHQLIDWGRLQISVKGIDKCILVLMEDEDNKIVGSALLLKQSLPFGLSWLYCPNGPLIDYENPEVMDMMLKKIGEIAGKESAVFFRMDPPVSKEADYVRDVELFYKKKHMRPAHAGRMPGHTLIIDLTMSEEEILRQMKPKGRYNIKVAGRHGVEIEKHNWKAITDKEKELLIDQYYKLLAQTTDRDGFSGHEKNYYYNLLNYLGEQRASIWTAKYQGRVITAGIITYLHNTATYYYGVSSNLHRNVMAPYLLHWEIMRDAKSHGYTHYDLFGIAPPAPNLRGQSGKSHPWASVSDFKLKFGGRRVDYLPGRELIFKPFWYFLLTSAKHLRGRFR